MSFKNGGIVSGNIEIVIDATCYSCGKRLDTKYCRGEVFICDRCAKKRFGIKVVK